MQALYKYVVPKPKSECTKQEQLGVSFAAGYIAGVFCAVVSHPADNLVSKLNAQKGARRARWQLPLRLLPLRLLAQHGSPATPTRSPCPSHAPRRPQAARSPRPQPPWNPPHPQAPPPATSSRRWAGWRCSPAACPCASS